MSFLSDTEGAGRYNHNEKKQPMTYTPSIKIEPSESSKILELQRKYLWPGHLLYYDEPLPLDHGKGSSVWDVSGNRYLDFFGGILTTSIGHGHPKLVEKTSSQIAKLIHSSTLYPHENHVRLAEKMAAITPGRLQKSYFTNSGTEANELALMAARAFTGNFDILALRHGYSGNSAVGKTLTAQSAWRLPGNVVPGIKHAINPYCYRCAFKMSYPSCDVACAQDVEDVIRTTTCGKIAGYLWNQYKVLAALSLPLPSIFPLLLKSSEIMEAL